MSEAQENNAAAAETPVAEETKTQGGGGGGGGGGESNDKTATDTTTTTTAAGDENNKAASEGGGGAVAGAADTSPETATTTTTTPAASTATTEAGGGGGGGEDGSKKEDGGGDDAAASAAADAAAGGDGDGGGAESSTSPPPPQPAAAATAPEEPNEAEEMYKKLISSGDQNGDAGSSSGGGGSSSSSSGSNKGVLRKLLTKSVLDKLKTKKTEKGATLADCIRAGVEVPDSRIGVYAPDPESYSLFAPLLDGVVKNLHGLPEKKQVHQPGLDFGDLEKVKLDNLDPDGKFVAKVSVSAARSLEGYAFLSLLSKESLEEIEEKAKEALKTLGDELEGSYQTLGDMDSTLLEDLLKEGVAFADTDKAVQAAGGYKDWPRGRGVFHTAGDKGLVAWINQEEHLKVTSRQDGADLAAAYGRLVKALKALGEKLTFVRDDRLGFLCFSPSSVGTGLRVSVSLRIPTAATQANFQTTLDKLHLQSKAVEGEDGVFAISNRRSVGLTEVQLITEVYNGARDLIKLEQELTWKPETLQEMVDHVTKTKSCKSLMKKHLSKDVVDRLKDKKTTMGATLADCIRSGSWNLDSGVGIYAADPESYTTFADLLDPVIKDYHKVKASDPIAHPAAEFGDLDTLELPDLDPEGELILSTRIRVGRSHKEYGFPPVLTKEDREAMEKKTVEALEGLGDELKGVYHPLTGMTQDTQDQLTKDHFLFNDSDRFLKAAGGYDDWPTGRGIYFNEAKTFLVWVNEEDHMRIISMQKGGDLGAVYKRLVTAVKALEEKLPFARDERLGYLTFCPSNLGTTLRASVHIKIPKLAARKDFKATCEKLKLQARGIHGEHTESEGGVYDISNKRRLGLTELQAVTEMYEGVKEIIKLEKDLQAGKGAKSSSCTII